MQIRSPHRLATLLLAVLLGACASEASGLPGSGTGSPGVPNGHSPSSGGTSTGASPGTPSTPSTPSSPDQPTEPSGPTPGLTLSVHTTLGIPAETPADADHALLVKPQYVVSFDGTRKNPRWTSWELTTAWLGAASRSPAFKPDPTLSLLMPQAKDSDYTNSGFSRGHLCPSADRTDSADDNAATFVFSNAVPQTTQSNTGPWEDLEREERALATAGHHLFIVAGSRYETDQTIGDGVSVPSSMFKVIVVMDGDSPHPSDVTTATRVIAVDIPNTTTVHGDYSDFLTSFGELETETGLRFMNDVSASIHDTLAAKIDSVAE